MDRNKNLYRAESRKSVSQFVTAFSAVVEKHGFVVNNTKSMDMKKTFREHGGDVPDDFDLHMMHVCKPAKAAKSLATNLERAIFMPKFVHVFSDGLGTQIRFMRHNPEHISELVPGDVQCPGSMTQTFDKICAMINEAK